VILLRRVIDRHEAFFGNAAMRSPDRRNDRGLAGNPFAADNLQRQFQTKPTGRRFSATELKTGMRAKGGIRPLVRVQ
jgi:hypothetical protein